MMTVKSAFLNFLWSVPLNVIILLFGKVYNKISVLIYLHIILLQPSQPLFRNFNFSEAWIGVFPELDKFLVVFFGLRFSQHTDRLKSCSVFKLIKTNARLAMHYKLIIK